MWRVAARTVADLLKQPYAQQHKDREEHDNGDRRVPVHVEVLAIFVN